MKPRSTHVFSLLGVDLKPSKGTLIFHIEKEAEELNCEFSKNFCAPKNYGDPVGNRSLTPLTERTSVGSYIS
jgi:hypothetical protein